jgi:hypothetical protein
MRGYIEDDVTTFGTPFFVSRSKALCAAGIRRPSNAYIKQVSNMISCRVANSNACHEATIGQLTYPLYRIMTFTI